MTQRQIYKDMTIEEALQTNCNLFQIKYDGIWARLEIQHGEVNIYSRTEKLKYTFPISDTSIDCTLIGEYMFGSQRSQHPDLKIKLFVFDCTKEGREDLHKEPYSKRWLRAAVLIDALGPPFNLVKPCPSLIYG